MTNKMTVSIYLITWNEEKMLPFSIEFYRKRFPNAQITIYDNFSTDNTVKIAKELGCEVSYYYTRNMMQDEALRNVKNNCWKGLNSWVIVADCDELINVCEEDLENEKASILTTCYVQMVGRFGNQKNITLGYRYGHGGKFLCFDASRVKEINYEFGAHYAHPFGDIEFSEKIYDIYHYKYISLKYVTERHAMIAKRLSPFNLKQKLSFHYLFSKRKIRKKYEWYLKNAAKIL